MGSSRTEHTFPLLKKGRNIMKRYSISYARFVNEQAAKSGIAFQYGGRTDNPEEVIKGYEANEHMVGLQIKDSQTKKVIYSHVRKVRGALLVTYKSEYSNSTYTVANKYVNFADMREAEHRFVSQLNKKQTYATVIKVEREIYG
jgi:hypothetical protein